MATKRKPTLYQSASFDKLRRLSIGKGSSVKYHQHGQDLARKGKYQDALDVLTEALLQEDATGANEILILDSRSAIYCKMGLYEKALKDARSMISADKQDERGYLRAGKALLLDNRPDTALDVYALGLERLPKSHPQREAVANIHAKLKDKMLSRLRDPVQHLNSDCLLEIFKHLPFRQTVAMTRVSKAWGFYIKSQPTLWYDISFKGSSPPVSLKQIKSCFQNSQNRVKRLQLHSVAHPLDALRQALACPRLEHLDLDISVSNNELTKLLDKKDNLKTIILSDKIVMDHQNLCKATLLNHLERLEVYNLAMTMNLYQSVAQSLPKLKALVLKMMCLQAVPPFKHFWVPGHAYLIDPAEFHPEITFWWRCPLLEELRLYANLNHNQPSFRMAVSMYDLYHPNLRILEIRGMPIIGALVLSEKLEYLRLVDCGRSHEFESEIDVLPTPATPIPELHPMLDSHLLEPLPTPELTTPPTVPNLKILELILLDWPRDEIKRALLHLVKHNDGSLETLHIELCDNLRVSDILALIEHPSSIKNLKKLYLRGMGLYSFDDNAAVRLFQQMPNLEELHVPNTAVTGITIKRIVSGLLPRSIKFLDVMGCADVTPEAIEWGREKGIKINTRSALGMYP